MKQRKSILSGFALFLFFLILQNSFSKDRTISYFIEFSDKKNNRYSIDQPSEYLSQRAIDRRTRMGIAITEQDLPLTTAYVQQIKNLGMTIKYQIKWLNGVLVKSANPAAISEAKKLDFVKNVIRVDRRTDEKTKINKFPKISPLDEEGLLPSHLQDKYNYGYATKQVKLINGNHVHNEGYDGKDQVISVIDAGFENANRLSAFDSLWQKGQILGTRDFVDPDQPDTCIFREHWHGTGVLSTMGAYTRRYVGTAPQASYWLMRTEEVDFETLEEEYFWAEAAEFSDSVGADVINTSLGYTEFDDSTQNHKYEDMDSRTTPCAKAANQAFKSGIAVVASAGNSGSDPWHYIGTPADAWGALAIGATDTAGNHAFFSSYGPTPDGRVKPDIAAIGWGSKIVWSNGDVDVGNGTSFAAPTVAGMVACVRQAKPDLEVGKLYELIQKNSSLYANPDDSMGFGIPDFFKAIGGSQQEFKPIHNALIKSKVHIFPRSFNDHITIQASDNIKGAFICNLVTINGRKVYGKKLDKQGKNHIYMLDDLTKLGSGTYILSITIDGEIITEKVYKYEK